MAVPAVLVATALMVYLTVCLQERERLERERLERERLARKHEEEKLLREEENRAQQERLSAAMATSQPEPEMEGLLQRKNELDEGGRKAVMRSWRLYYTALVGPLLTFYREKKDFQQNMAAAPAINVSHGVCEIAKDYQKKKNALRLKLPNGAEYLFIARDEADLLGWVEAINRAIHTQENSNPLSASAHFLPSSLNPLSTGPISSSGLDTPPDSLPPPPPSSVPPPEEERPLSSLSTVSDLLEMQPHSGSTEMVTSVSHQELPAEEKRRRKGRFKMFGTSRK